MNVGDITTERRGRNVSLFGLILHVILSLCLFLIYGLNNSAATFVAAKYSLGGVFIWMALLIIYQQRRHVAEEKLETELLAKERQTEGTVSIFELEHTFLVVRLFHHSDGK